jgi:hypothetical protein
LKFTVLFSQLTFYYEVRLSAGCWWLTPVILATLKAEIRRIMVQRQARQIVCETLSEKKKSQKRASGVPQCVSLELKS